MRAGTVRTRESFRGSNWGNDPWSRSNLPRHRHGVRPAAAGPFPPVFTVRKEAKEYGAGRRIEGNFSTGDPVVVVDDVITTGGSTLRAIDAIESEGGRVLFAFVLVDREEGGRKALEERGIQVVSLFTRSELLAGS